MFSLMSLPALRASLPESLKTLYKRNSIMCLESLIASFQASGPSFEIKSAGSIPGGNFVTLTSIPKDKAILPALLEALNPALSESNANTILGDKRRTSHKLETTLSFETVESDKAVPEVAIVFLYPAW